MSKAPSPLLGYNNNVRHKNKVFHIQTEDSGVKYGHIITHLFMDGGRILKSVKTSYQEYLSNEKLADIIREMMKQQHKAMFIALRDGKFDHLVEGKAEPSPRAAPAEAEEPAKERPPASASAAKKASRAASGSPKKSPTPTRVETVPQIHTGVRADADEFDEEPKTVRNADPLTLDIDALERAAAAADSHSGSFKPAGDLPPPPTNLFREKSATGSYRTVKPSSPPEATNPSRPPPPPSKGRPPSAPPRTPPPKAPPATRRAPSPPPPAPLASPTVRPIPRNPPPAPVSERRYAPTRPASIFGQARPQQGKTIFGEDLISDKSLDEVILSYLADDLEPPPAEKNAKKK